MVCKKLGKKGSDTNCKTKPADKSFNRASLFFKIFLYFLQNDPILVKLSETTIKA